MWSRKELKEKSKFRMKANYWKAVLVAFILSCLVGSGFSDLSSFSGASSGANARNNIDTETVSDSTAVLSNPDDFMEQATDEFDVMEQAAGGMTAMDFTIFMAIMVIVTLIVVVVICMVVIPLQVFIFNPLIIGCRRFFTKNLNDNAAVKELCYSFDNGYKNGISIMFFRDLYTFLWTLLFIIPGIVKGYEYLMIPYLLAENPNMSKKQAFALSKQMMTGNKWKAFVLDLSFLGWKILSACTLGILGIFYVEPYYHQTFAALYEALKLPVIPENN